MADLTRRRRWHINSGDPVIVIISPTQSRLALKCLTGSSPGSEDDPLLNEPEAGEDSSIHVVTVPQLLTARELRKPLAIICLAMASQQLSGKPPIRLLSAQFQLSVFGK